MAVDPGGIFDSDTHRRVEAALPNPDDEPLSVEDLMVERIEKDDHLNLLTVSDLVETLKDLEADGYAENTHDCWKNTERGFEVLTGPIANEPPAVKEKE